VDAEHFDTWTKALSAGTGSRRDALRLLAGGALTTVLARFAPGVTATQATVACRPLGKKCRKGDKCCGGRCKHRKCRCTGDTKPCSGRCIPSANRCNGDACDDGNPCTGDGTWQDGACTSGAPLGNGTPCGVNRTCCEDTCCPVQEHGIKSCSGNVCGIECDAGYQQCGDTCVPETSCCVNGQGLTCFGDGTRPGGQWCPISNVGCVCKSGTCGSATCSQTGATTCNTSTGCCCKPFGALCVGTQPDGACCSGRCVAGNCDF
jgi:hypothetical protein